ncbi:TonB-dependent receptor plug domain-containing protein [Agrobacterium salinitolerans]|uniref:TonB-dependent receptor plug domain-containing protein n=1 Tax=Agrobacterium salinitolerans TaxID=1183413 RepID=UPI001574B680|nr:TonB-dependent siderophore receptor [Agrobacterium salinitolerans]MCZ7861955.1 TonB-dependent siderophore receptor [Agrobacterium salinitolerans]NTA39261.1 TonB-dependent siderophore receptor [Agrobacterium salinitolerans]
MELKYRGREKSATIIKAGLSAAMAGTALCIALPSFAQQAPEGSTVLEQIVVTASGFEQNVKDAPASITVVTREDLEKGSYRDLTDALREVQGVSVTGIANEKDIFIRGLPGAYTLVLVDGKRQSTRDARTNGNSGFEQSFVPPVSAIERIEVVRGPMSSLYGSDAMGGVINIITRKVGDVWSGSVTTEGTVQQHSKFGNSGQVSWYANGPILKDRLGLQLWGRGFTRGEDRILSGTTGAKEYDFNGRLTFTPNEDHDIYLEGGKTRLRRSAEPGDTLAATDANGTYNTNTRDHWSLSHTGRWGPTTSEFSFQQEWAERTNFTRNIRTGRVTENPRSPEVRNTVLDGKFTTPFELFGNHTLVTGGQYFEARLTDQNPGRRTGRDETFSATQWALFLEDEWRIVDNFALTGGLRLDNHEKYGNHFSPRLYGVWSATEEMTIKGGVSTGFRAPEIRQIAPGYAYTTGGGGCSYGPSGTCGVIIGDPNLEAEKSTSYEVAALWDNGDVALGATYFYTDFKDKISNALVLNPDGTPARWSEDRNYRLWYNYNIDDAVIQGVELTATWYATPDLTLRGNYTYTHSEQKTGDYEGFPLARTPEHMANLRGDWVTPIDGLEAWASLNYHGSEINAGPRIGTNGTPVTINGKAGRKYDAYTTLDIGAKYAVAENVDLKAAIYNVFDKDVGTDDFNTVMEGRRFWISMTAKF